MKTNAETYACIYTNITLGALCVIFGFGAV